MEAELISFGKQSDLVQEVGGDDGSGPFQMHGLRPSRSGVVALVTKAPAWRAGATGGIHREEYFLHVAFAAERGDSILEHVGHVEPAHAPVPHPRQTCEPAPLRLHCVRMVHHRHEIGEKRVDLLALDDWPSGSVVLNFAGGRRAKIILSTSLDRKACAMSNVRRFHPLPAAIAMTARVVGVHIIGVARPL